MTYESLARFNSLKRKRSDIVCRYVSIQDRKHVQHQQSKAFHHYITSVYGDTNGFRGYNTKTLPLKMLSNFVIFDMNEAFNYHSRSRRSTATLPMFIYITTN